MPKLIVSFIGLVRPLATLDIDERPDHTVPPRSVLPAADLEFYDAVAGSPKDHSDQTLTRIDHEDNLLIAFPSQTFHGITDVHCDSDDFADGRFAAIGFLGPQ